MNRIMRNTYYFLLLILFPAASLHAQSEYSATAPGMSISVGGEASTFNPDWDCRSASAFACWHYQFLGLGVYANANHIKGRFGAEAEARWLHWRGPGQQIVQSNYLIGPRYQFFQHHKLSADVKILIGGSWMTFPNNIASGSYFTVAPGVTGEYRLTRKLTVRGDYEYQYWPSFSGISFYPNNGLNPNGFSLGVSYRVWR